MTRMLISGFAWLLETMFQASEMKNNPFIWFDMAYSSKLAIQLFQGAGLYMG